MEDISKRLGDVIRLLDGMDSLKGRHNCASLVMSIDTLVDIRQKLEGVVVEEKASFEPHTLPDNDLENKVQHQKKE